MGNDFLITLHHRLKDGFPVTEKSPRYLVHGYALIIKDVTAEDAGDYTVLLAIKQYGVFQNLTTTLIVNGKFVVVLSSGSGKLGNQKSIGQSQREHTFFFFEKTHF